MLTALKDKKFLTKLAAIGIPIAGQNLITYAVGMMDTLMLGQMGETELSASALAGQLSFVFMIMIFGTASGANVLLSQYWGKGDTVSVKRVFALATQMAALFSVIFTLLALFVPEPFMRLCTKDEQVIALGVEYLKILGWSFPLFGLANLAIMALRSVGEVKISIVVYSASMVVEVVLNWAFIFGKLGFPAMGVAGAALSTVIARMVEFVITFGYLFLVEKKLRFRPAEFLCVDKQLLRGFTVNVMPVILNEGLWSVGAATISMIIGRMSTGFTAANTIASSINQLVMVFSYGVSNATAVIVGHSIGEGQHQQAKERANASIFISLLVGLSMCALMFLSRGAVLNLYKLTAETRATAMSVMAVSAVMVVFQTLAVVSLVGILRAGGDTRFALFCDILFLWCFAVPLGAFAGLRLHLPPTAVFAILKSDEIIKSFIAIFRIVKYPWIRDLTQ